MPNIMQQGCIPQYLQSMLAWLQPTKPRVTMRKNTSQYHCCALHHTYRMDKSWMLCRRIYIFCQGQLVDSAQTLEKRGVNNTPLMICKRYKSVNRITDFISWQRQIIQELFQGLVLRIFYGAGPIPAFLFSKIFIKRLNGFLYKFLYQLSNIGARLLLPLDLLCLVFSSFR